MNKSNELSYTKERKCENPPDPTISQPGKPYPIANPLLPISHHRKVLRSALNPHRLVLDIIRTSPRRNILMFLTNFRPAVLCRPGCNFAAVLCQSSVISPQHRILSFTHTTIPFPILSPLFLPPPLPLSPSPLSVPPSINLPPYPNNQKHQHRIKKKKKNLLQPTNNQTINPHPLRQSRPFHIKTLCFPLFGTETDAPLGTLRAA